MDAIYRKHKTYSAMERIPLHSWETEFSIQYHVTINSQLNDQNSIRYYIKSNHDVRCQRESFDFLVDEHKKEIKLFQLM